MNFSKKPKVLLAWCIVVSMIISLAMPILAYANSGTPVISYDGKTVLPEIEPYENNLGLMVSARDLADVFSFEYTANSKMKYFIIHHESFGDVVLMHNATSFISGETRFDCAPYFYYENGIPMIEAGFFCEMFGAQYNLLGTEIVISEKIEMEGLQIDALGASDAASYAATKSISGTASFDRNVVAPAEGIDVSLHISTFSDIRTTTYGVKYRDFEKTAKIGTIHFDKGEKTKDYSFSLRNIIYNDDYSNYIIYYTTEDTDYLYEDAYFGNDGKMHSYLYTYYRYYDCPDDAKVFSFKNANTANIKLLTTDKYGVPVTGKAGDNITWSLNRSTGVLTLKGTGEMYDYLYYLQWKDYKSEINSVVIGNGITSIGERAFYRIPITSVTMPASVKTIEAQAFYDCEYLEEVKLPARLDAIHQSAFAYCSSLQSITLPSLVTSIGSSAFSNCTSLEEITLPSSLNLNLMGASVFYGCSGLETIYAPQKLAAGESFWKGTKTSANVIYDNWNVIYKQNGLTVKTERVEPGTVVSIPSAPSVPDGGIYILTVNGKPYTGSTVTVNGNTVISQTVVSPASTVKTAIECNSFKKETDSSAYSYSCNIESIADEEISGTAVVAMYDSTGKLVGYQKVSASSALSGQLITDGDPESYKIMIVDTDTLIPSSFCCEGIID